MRKNVYRYWRPQSFMDKVYRDTDKAVGYCVCDKHRGYLTKGLMKSHRCSEKNCVFLHYPVKWGAPDKILESSK